METMFDHAKIEESYLELQDTEGHEARKVLFDQIAETAKVGYGQPNDENGVLGEEYTSEDSEWNLITCLVFPAKISYQRTAQVWGEVFRFTLLDTGSEIVIG